MDLGERTEMAGLVGVSELLLGPEATSPRFLRREAVTHIVRAHLAGERNQTAALGSLLTLELWRRGMPR